MAWRAITGILPSVQRKAGQSGGLVLGNIEKLKASPLPQKAKRPTRVASCRTSLAALPQNCLTTAYECRWILAFRPHHFSNILRSELNLFNIAGSHDA